MYGNSFNADVIATLCVFNEFAADTPGLKGLKFT